MMANWKQNPRNEKRIYADAAASTPLSLRVQKELIRLLDVYGNAGSLHKEAVTAKQEIEKARKTIAQAIGAHADEIFFTASGTEANNLALEGILRPRLRVYGEAHAITTTIEHPSILEPLRALEREGLYTTVLPVNSEGFISVDELGDAINEHTAIVSIQIVNSEVGTIQPIREIAKKIRRMRRNGIPLSSPSEAFAPQDAAASSESTDSFIKDIETLPLYFHVDASQAPLWLELKVDRLGVDMMTLDGQKILGPKGIGILYIKRGTDIEPIIWGGSQEQGFRAGTQNTPLIGVLAVALSDAQKGVAVRAQKVARLRDQCFEEIKKRLPDVLLNGPTIQTSAIRPSDSLSASTAQHRRSSPGLIASARVANNLNISIPGLEAQMAVIALDAEGIAASTRSACSAGEEEPSHVIQALGTPPELAGTAIRITFLPDISAAQIKRIAQTLAEIANRYRKVL